MYIFLIWIITRLSHSSSTKFDISYLYTMFKVSFCMVNSFFFAHLSFAFALTLSTISLTLVCFFGFFFLGVQLTLLCSKDRRCPVSPFYFVNKLTSLQYFSRNIQKKRVKKRSVILANIAPFNFYWIKWAQIYLIYVIICYIVNFLKGRIV